MNLSGHANFRRLAGAWFALALTALGLSALFAVFLVAARTPFLGQGAGLFRTALVLHVDLAVLVWFLALAAGSWSLAAGKAGGARWTVFWVAAVGMIAMLAIAPASGALPILSNYIPLLDHPLFLLGLALFAGSAALSGLLSLPGAWRSAQPWRLAASLSVIALLVAAGVLAIDYLTAGRSRPIGTDELLWGTGHMIQFVHILVLMGAWQALGKSAIAHSATLERALPWLYALSFLPVLAGPVIAIAMPVGSVEHRMGFTALMRWGTWPGAALLGIFLSVGLVRLRRKRPLDAEEKGLALSLLLFALGCLLGAMIRGETLAVPAHYHGTVGAVTLAYLVWLRLLARELLGISPEKLAPTRALPLVYGTGIALLVAGLAVAGHLGVPRKAPHVELSANSASYLAAMGLAGVGGFLALAAITAFAILSFRGAYRAWRPVATRRDMRGWAAAATVLIVLAGGLLLDRLPRSLSPEPFSAPKHAAEKIQADLALRFEQGVMMLHAKQYEHALTAFHSVLQRAPNMPEAYVNMGFALMGLKRHKQARDFFESATQLRVTQVNAYYGLAVALEGMGDMEGALGAMQTYIHLSKPEDSFRRKAESAIWEWRSILASRTSDQAPAN